MKCWAGSIHPLSKEGLIPKSNVLKRATCSFPIGGIKIQAKSEKRKQMTENKPNQTKQTPLSSCDLSVKMPLNDDVELEYAATTSSNTVRSRADPFLLACRGFSVLTSLAAILCIAVNVISAVRSFKHGSDIFNGIFRCYAVLAAAFVVLAETEWSFVLKFSKVLEYWAARGMLQIFVAVMTRAFPDLTGDQGDLFLLQSIASYVLIACGAVYVLSGILCIGFLKRARQKQKISREQAAKDLEELERRKEELEQLLLAHRV